MRCRTAWMLGWISCCVAAGGCSWVRPRASDPLPPPVFLQMPTLDQTISTINDTADRVQRLQTDSATLRIAGLPSLRADLAYERPRRFRLRAELFQFTGRELDLGSNDELLWIWTRRGPQPGVFYVRHDQLASPAMRQFLPVEPNWLVEALGLVRLEPTQRHEGPYVHNSETLELRSYLPGPEGELLRILYVDAHHAWVTEQQLYDPHGRLLAAARAGDFHFYPIEGVSLPHHIEVRLNAGQPGQMLDFELEVGGYLINRLTSDASELWSLPRIEGHPPINVADAVSDSAGASAPAYTVPTPRSSQLPAYRGSELR